MPSIFLKMKYIQNMWQFNNLLCVSSGSCLALSWVRISSNFRGSVCKWSALSTLFSVVWQSTLSSLFCLCMAEWTFKPVLYKWSARPTLFSVVLQSTLSSLFCISMAEWCEKVTWYKWSALSTLFYVWQSTLSSLFWISMAELSVKVICISGVCEWCFVWWCGLWCVWGCMWCCVVYKWIDLYSGEGQVEILIFSCFGFWWWTDWWMD